VSNLEIASLRAKCGLLAMTNHPLVIARATEWPVAIYGPPHVLSLRASAGGVAISLLGFPIHLGYGDCRVRAKYALPRNDS